MSRKKGSGVLSPAPISASTCRTPSGSTTSRRRNSAMLLRYIIKRILIMVPTLVVTSALIFTVMELPPGDFFETYVAEMQAQGEKADTSRIDFLKKEYGFDRPPIERYFYWVTGL